MVAGYPGSSGGLAHGSSAERSKSAARGGFAGTSYRSARRSRQAERWVYLLTLLSTLTPPPVRDDDQGRSRWMPWRASWRVALIQTLNFLESLFAQQSGLMKLLRVVALPRSHFVAFALVHPQRHQFEIDDDVVQFHRHRMRNNMVHAQFVPFVWPVFDSR